MMRAEQNGARPLWARLCLLSLTSILYVKLATYYTDAHFGLTEEFPPTSLEAFATLHLPAGFKWRPLIPWIVNWLWRGWGFDYYLCFYFIEMVSWLALLCCAYWALEEYPLGMSKGQRVAIATSVGLPLCLVLVAPVAYFKLGAERLEIVRQYLVPYDVPSAAFAFGCYVALLKAQLRDTKKHLMIYGALFLLASMNRENTVFFALLSFWALRERLPLRDRWAILLTQLVVFAVVRSLVVAVVAGNDTLSPSGAALYELQFLNNIKRLTLDAYLKKMLFSYACGGIFVFLFFSWPRFSIFNKQTFGLYCVPVLVVGFVFGVVSETRIYAELAPIAWMFFVQSSVAQPAALGAPPR